MQLPRTSPAAPTGLSFDIPDLLLLRGWAEFHDLRMTIELDVCADGAEYEELLALRGRHRAFRRWMIWRSRNGIIVQSATGCPMRFDCMGDALDVLIPTRD
jgi:hypothetical protein